MNKTELRKIMIESAYPDLIRDLEEAWITEAVLAQIFANTKDILIQRLEQFVGVDRASWSQLKLLSASGKIIEERRMRGHYPIAHARASLEHLAYELYDYHQREIDMDDINNNRPLRAVKMESKLEYLHCPWCGRNIKLGVSKVEDGHS